MLTFWCGSDAGLTRVPELSLQALDPLIKMRYLVTVVKRRMVRSIVCLYGFSSATRLYSGRAQRLESDNFMCCHTETERVDNDFCLSWDRTHNLLIRSRALYWLSYCYAGVRSMTSLSLFIYIYIYIYIYIHKAHFVALMTLSAPSSPNPLITQCFYSGHPIYLKWSTNKNRKAAWLLCQLCPHPLHMPVALSQSNFLCVM